MKLFLAVTVSFTPSLFLHHCYHHTTLSHSHLSHLRLHHLHLDCRLSRTVQVGRTIYAFNTLAHILIKVFFPCTRTLFGNAFVGRVQFNLDQGLWCMLEGGKNWVEFSLNLLPVIQHWVHWVTHPVLNGECDKHTMSEGSWHLRLLKNSYINQLGGSLVVAHSHIKSIGAWPGNGTSPHRVAR